MVIVDRIALAPRIAAQRAGVLLGHVHAHRAEPDLVGHVDQRLREVEDLLAIAAHQVEREPRGGLLADPWQAGQLLHQPANRIGGHD